jgi:virulence-associated protein VapD
MKMIIDEVYKINYNSYILIKNHKDKLEKLKTNIQRYLIRNHIYKDSLEITNDTDPFTFDNIKEVKRNERFIYNDGSNNYFFKAIELKYFLETNGNWNPYTKKPINEEVIKNLDIFIKINNLIHKNKNDRYNWLSVNQAFTDVSQILERMGFYNNSEWFIKLSPKQIKNIIHLFNVMSATNQTYFNNMDDNNLFYDFAKEIIRLFEDGNSNFLDCCIFMKAISVYSNDFYNSLPEWIADIETPLIIIDNSNLFYLIWNNSN